ncbi:hypothetical protein JXA80_04595, partial [bacterium]|nr:hypothetical protein [candidate division CSSED10-310 bacterium]
MKCDDRLKKCVPTCRIMILLSVTALLPWVPIHAAGDTLDTLRGQGAFVSVWEPLVPPDFSDHHVTVIPGTDVEIHVPPGSGLRILSDDSGSRQLRVFRKQAAPTTCSLEIRIPTPFSPMESPAHSSADNTIEYSEETAAGHAEEYPGNLLQETTFILTADTFPIRVALFQLTSIHRPFFWERVRKTACRLHATGRLYDAFDPLYRDVITQDDWSFFGLWVRCMGPAMDAANAQEHPTPLIAAAITDITHAFAILAGENTVSETLDIVAETRCFIEPDAVGLPQAVPYSVLRPTDTIPVSGPAWMTLHLRADLPESPARKMVDIPLAFRIDQSRTGHWPEGTCRFLFDADQPVSTNADVSSPMFHKVYIPRGDHHLAIESTRTLYIHADITRPVFPDIDPALDPFPVRPFSMIPVERLRDIQWFENQFLLHGNNPILRLTALHYSNRFHWISADPPDSGQWRLDPVESGDLYPIASDYFDPMVTVPDRPDHPGRVTLLHLFDPDRTPGDMVPTIVLNGHHIQVPDLADPFETPLRIGIPVFPGTHRIHVKTHGRRMFLDGPVDSMEPAGLTARLYHPVTRGGHDPEPLVFTVSGDTNGAPFRLFFRCGDVLPIRLHLDGTPWMIVQLHAVQDQPNGFFGRWEGSVPPGNHRLSVHSNDETLEVALYQPRWAMGLKTDIARDPFLETCLYILDHPPTQPDLCTILSRDAMTLAEKVLYLLFVPDPVRARDIFLPVYDPAIASHRMVLSWIYADLGYADRALDIAWPIIDDPTFPFSVPFLKKMLDTALTRTGLYRPMVIAQQLHDHGWSDEVVDSVLNNPLATDPGESLSPLQLAGSRHPNFRPLPDTALSGNLSTIILDDLLDPDRQKKIPSRNPWEYQILSSGYPDVPASQQFRIHLPKPAILRLLIRSLTPTVEPDTYGWVTLAIHTGGKTIQIELPAGTPDRDTLQWRTLLNPVMKAVALHYPVMESGDVEIECIQGCIALQCATQIPGSADFRIDPVSPNFITAYTALLTSARVDILDFTARAIELQRQYPGVYLLDSLVDTLTGQFRSHVLSGWPERAGGKRYLSTGGTLRDPVMRMRCFDVPDPQPGFPAYCLVKNSVIYLAPEPGIASSIHCITRSVDGNPFRIRIEHERRTVCELHPDNPSCVFDWPPDQTGRLRISAETIDGSFPVKVAVLQQSGSRIQSVPVHENRRYHEVNPDGRTEISGRIIGPAFLELESRVVDSVGIDAVLEIDAMDSHGRLVYTETVLAGKDPDDGMHSVPENHCVSLPARSIIPITGSDVYTVTVRHTGVGPAAVVRMTARQHPSRSSESHGNHLIPRDIVPGDTTETASLMGTNAIPVHRPDWETHRNWDPRVDSADIGRSGSAGTWGAIFGYRYRDRDDDRSDPDLLYAGEGISGHMTWNKRFDGSPHSGRIYTDTMAGGTQPESEPDDFIGHARQTMTWHIADTGFRSRLSIDGAIQSMDNGREWRMRVQGDIRRTLHLSPTLTWMVGIGGSMVKQSMDSLDAGMLSDAPHPLIYTGFDDRHRTNLYLLTQVQWHAGPHSQLFLRFRTMTSGDGESGEVGPWWARGGFRYQAGPCTVEAA